MRPIVHPTDFSAAGRPAFREAVAWARRRHAVLHLLHVITPPVMILEDSFLSARSWARLEALQLHAIARRMTALQAQARKAGVVTAVTIVRSAVPFDAIVRAAKRVGADLLVLGTHGRTGLARVAIGSVAERVMARAPCPVLTVRVQARGRGRR
jgi:nucleotide-binding universal stress UspA family protein